MKRKGWLLLAIGDSIEPIQLQKTLFKFAMESDVPDNQKYDFEPYNWGPCAKQIYPDIGDLRTKGFVEALPTGQGWSCYRLTPEGEAVAIRVRKAAPPQQLQELEETREWVMQRPFRRLLKDVYKQYPEFAEKSLFK